MPRTTRVAIPDATGVPIFILNAVVNRYISQTNTEAQQRHIDHVCLHTEVAVLAEWWNTETGDIASQRERFRHPAYQRIIALGWPAVPHILRELRENRGYWFEALSQITGGTPVLPEERNSYDAVRRAWLEWGMGLRQHVQAR
jgi:hypothetical protein